MCEAIAKESISEQLERGYDLLRESAGWFELDHKLAFELTGEDRKGWLQGQVTNDLRKLDTGGSIHFCLCSPTGQIEAICQMWAFSDKYLLTVDKDAAAALVERCEKNVVLEDVTLTHVPCRIISVQGPEASRSLSSDFELPHLDSGVSECGESEVTVLRSNRTGMGGWDLLIPSRSKKPLALIERAVPRVTAESYRIAELEFGVPRFGVDTDAKTLPPELGETFTSQHVSYTKGCYSGQEVLMRIFSRGHTNRTWRALASEYPIPSESRILFGGNEVGRITSGGFSPEFGHIAAGMVRNGSAEPGDSVAIESSGSRVEATLYEIPLLRLG